MPVMLQWLLEKEWILLFLHRTLSSLYSKNCHRRSKINPKWLSPLFHTAHRSSLYGSCDNRILLAPNISCSQLLNCEVTPQMKCCCWKSGTGRLHHMGYPFCQGITVISHGSPCDNWVKIMVSGYRNVYLTPWPLCLPAYPPHLHRTPLILPRPGMILNFPHISYTGNYAILYELILLQLTVLSFTSLNDLPQKTQSVTSQQLL